MKWCLFLCIWVNVFPGALFVKLWINDDWWDLIISIEWCDFICFWINSQESIPYLKLITLLLIHRFHKQQLILQRPIVKILIILCPFSLKLFQALVFQCSNDYILLVYMIIHTAHNTKYFFLDYDFRLIGDVFFTMQTDVCCLSI